MVGSSGPEVGRVIFVVGKDYGNRSASIARESFLHGDILQVDICEAYKMLSVKIHAFLWWATANCQSVQYFFKLDVDTFILPHNLNIFYDKLERHKDKTRHSPGIWCQVSPRTKTPRDRISARLYPEAYLPPYCSGHGYLLNQAAARTLLSHQAHNNQVTSVEDAYFTGILAQASGIQRIHVPDFNGDGLYRKLLCSDSFITIHNMKTANSVYRMHIDYLEHIKNCTTRHEHNVYGLHVTRHE